MKKRTFFQTRFRDNFFAGILVLGPFSAVIWLLGWIWRFLLGLTDAIPGVDGLRMVLQSDNPLFNSALNIVLTLIMVGIGIVVIWAAGIISRNYFGKSLLKMFRRFIAKLPVFKTVYSTLEQLLETFTSDKSKNFRGVVELDYPRQGIRTLALVTGERPGDFLTIFVPTTPNPTSGFYLKVRASEVTRLEMSVEDALKEIISMGLVTRDSTKED